MPQLLVQMSPRHNKPSRWCWLHWQGSKKGTAVDEGGGGHGVVQRLKKSRVMEFNRVITGSLG